MEDSDSFAVDFGGVRLDRDDLLGAPGDYERSPWFTAGASRFVAVQTGGIEQLVADFGAFLRRREQHDDPIQLTRFGECVIAARTALLWTNACADAWMRYDALPGETTEAELLVTVDAARSAVERSALDVAERVERGVGARGLLETEPFARRLRDLRMYSASAGDRCDAAARRPLLADAARDQLTEDRASPPRPSSRAGSHRGGPTASPLHARDRHVGIFHQQRPIALAERAPGADARTESARARALPSAPTS